MAENLQCAREVVVQRFFEFFAPPGRIRWQSTRCESRRREIKPRVQSAPAIKSQLLVVEFVKIMKDSANAEAFVVIEGLFEYPECQGAAVRHQIFSYQPAGIRQSVRTLRRTRQQQQSRCLRAVGAQNHGLRLLPNGVLLRIKIQRADRSSVLVHLDLVNVTVRPDFTAPRPFRHGKGGRQRRRLRPDFAAKPQTEPAVHTGTSSRSRLRQDRHWRWIWVIPQFPRRSFKHYAVSLYRQWRHRVRLRPRRVKRTRACQPRNSNLPVHLRVVRLQVRIRYRPIGQCRPRNISYLAVLDEVDF